MLDCFVPRNDGYFYIDPIGAFYQDIAYNEVSVVIKKGATYVTPFLISQG